MDAQPVAVADDTTVIVCSRGRPLLLLDTVTALLAMELLPAELVIVDQSEEANTELQSWEPPAPVRMRYLWSPDRGLSRARNAGLAAATGRIVAFMDDDMLAAPDWLAVLRAAAHSQGPRHVITGRVEPGPPEVPGAWAPSTMTGQEPHSYTGQLKRDVLSPSNVVLHRSAAAEVGPFDERLGAGTSMPAAEDNDYCYRLLKRGYTIDYCPEAVTVHRAWRDEGALTRLRFDYGRGQGGFYMKYILSGDTHMLYRFASDLYRHGRRAARRFRHDRSGSRNDVAYTRGLIVGALTWLRSR